MLGVTAEADGLVGLASGVAENVHQAIVITGRDQETILGEVDIVNMGAIGPRGEDTINQPAELGVVGGPLDTGGVGGTVRVLVVGVSIEEEELVGTADGSDVVSVEGPIDRGDIRVVFLAHTDKAVIGDRVDVDLVIVGANCELGAIRRVFHVFDPLLSVVGLSNNVIKLVNTFTNGQSTVVVTDCDVSVACIVGDSSCAFGVSISGEGGCTTSLDLAVLIADLSTGDALTGRGRPSLNFVVIT